MPQYRARGYRHLGQVGDKRTRKAQQRVTNFGLADVKLSQQGFQDTDARRSSVYFPSRENK